MTADADTIFLALARSEDAVSRLDERVRASAFRGGWATRLDYAEAVSWGWTSGNVVSSEELVLHDHGADIRTPDQTLRAAHGVVSARRKAVSVGPEILSAEGAAWLIGTRKRPPRPGASGDRRPVEPDPADIDRPDLPARLAVRLHTLTRGMSETMSDGVREWTAFLMDRERDTPLLLQGAAALEAWTIIDPMPNHRFIGPILVSHWLRERKRVASHLLGIESGARAQARRRRDTFAATPAARLAYWLRVMTAGAEEGLAELHRLELARQVAAQHTRGRRADSRLEDTIAFLLEQPVVTAPMLAETLAVSQTTARRLLTTLGSSVKEISGRSRFRAWRL